MLKLRKSSLLEKSEESFCYLLNKANLASFSKADKWELVKIQITNKYINGIKKVRQQESAEMWEFPNVHQKIPSFIPDLYHSHKSCPLGSAKMNRRIRFFWSQSIGFLWGNRKKGQNNISYSCFWSTELSFLWGHIYSGLEVVARNLVFEGGLWACNLVKCVDL